MVEWPFRAKNLKVCSLYKELVIAVNVIADFGCMFSFNKKYNLKCTVSYDCKVYFEHLPNKSFTLTSLTEKVYILLHVLQDLFHISFHIKANHILSRDTNHRPTGSTPGRSASLTTGVRITLPSLSRWVHQLRGLGKRPSIYFISNFKCFEILS